MGGIKRKRSKFRKPKKAFDKLRIKEEEAIVGKYGLKNKKEIWKAEAEISKLRRRAKALIPKSDEEKKEFFEKLNHLGLKIKIIADVLALTKENWLDRRLQTFVFKKELAKTIKQARQLIVHKLVLVDNKIVNKPSFVIKTDLENKISLKERKLKEKAPAPHSNSSLEPVVPEKKKANEIVSSNEEAQTGVPVEGKEEIKSKEESGEK